MKKVFISIVLSLFCFCAFSQSSEVITDILNTEKVTYGQICYLSAVHQGFVSDDSSYTQAINTLYEKGQIPVKEYEGTALPMVNLTYLFAQMWDIKGGIFYRIFHGAPRYAFKQLKADGVLPANASPGNIISGQEALNIYTACAIKYGNMQLNIE